MRASIILILIAACFHCGSAATTPNPLGVALTDLIAISPTGSANVSTSGESNLADFYCKALLGDKPAKALTACVINGGSFEANIPAGNITLKTLQTVYPYNDTYVRLQISGNTLLQVLQHGVSAYPTLGWWPQVANLRYSFVHIPNMQSPTGYTTNLVNANLINGTTVYGLGGDDPSVVLVTSSYIANGNDGYDMLKGAKVVSKSAMTLNGIVAEYIVKQGAVGAPVEGRIVDCTSRTGDAFCVASTQMPPANEEPAKTSSANGLFARAGVLVVAMGAFALAVGI